MEFKELTLSDRAWITEKLTEDQRQGCEFTFGNNFIWRKIYGVEATELFDCAVIRFHSNGQTCYSFPLGGGNKRKAVEALIAIAAEENQPFQMSTILAEDKAGLEEWFPNRFDITEERDNFDYIYLTEKLTKLAGKKLHGKRNHIARFKDNNWSYEPMNSDNKMECLKMNEIWCDRQQCKWNQDMEDEFCAVKEAIENFEALGFVGGVLRVNGEIVAFTIGEPLNKETFVVHIEKAFAEIQGAYPMINQQFVEHECQEYTYVNREEDTGAEGLRKAKLSYYPELLLEKYSAKFYAGH